MVKIWRKIIIQTDMLHGLIVVSWVWIESLLKKILARFKLGFVYKKSVLNFELTACACDAAFVFEFIKKNDKSQYYYIWNFY